MLAALQAQVDRRFVVVHDELTKALADDFELREGRPPNPSEQRALQEAWVDQELDLREARRLKLDRGDPIIRRRLLQQVGLLDEASTPEQVAPAQSTWIALDQRFDGAFPHGCCFALRPQQDYVELFGQAFAESLATAPVGAWTPIESRYGTHEVLITERSVGDEPRAPLEASARLLARDEAIAVARRARREDAWVWF